MVGTRFQSNRPFTAPILELTIVESPVATKDPEPVFPMSIIRSVNSDIEQEVKHDTLKAFKDIEEVDKGDVVVSELINSVRGLGETKKVTIEINVKDTMPEQLSEAVDDMIDMGYKFTDTRLK